MSSDAEKKLDTHRKNTEHDTQFGDCLKAGMTVPTLCVLCQKVPPQVCSHVIPRLVSRHIGERLGSLKLRGTENINRPVQDTAKYPLLCRSCEHKFGGWERSFMINHFEPYFEGTYNESYTQDFYNLLLSVVFRTLSYIAAAPERHRMTKRILRLVEEWRRYLDKGTSLAYKGLYAVRHHELELIPGWYVKNKTFTAHGVYQSSCIQNQARYFVYAQMGPFHVFADLGDIDEKGTPIDPSWTPFEMASNGGNFSKVNQLPEELQFILFNVNRRFSTKLDTVSETQLAKIRATQEKHNSRLQDLGLK